jgi:hypothetical protein
MMRQFLISSVLVMCLARTGFCGEADVVGVDVARTGQGVFRFDVTVKHDDTGWDHYADKWEIITPNGTLVGTRVLHHPHVGKQPFTRSLSGIRVPESIDEVTVRVHDSIYAYGGATITVKIPH